MAPTRPFVIRAAGVFAVPGATAVRVHDGLITAIGGPEILRDGDGQVHGGTGWLLPGLVDAHVHLGPGTTRLAALHGVTTVIDQFSTPALLAEELQRTSRPGAGVHAHLRVAGVGATAPGGHPSMAYSPIPTLTAPHQAQAFVAARAAEGATHLKVIYDDGLGAHLDLGTLSQETICALVAAAHARGMVVVAHVSTAAGAVLVARCGVDVLGHVPFESLEPEHVSELAERGVAVVATLSIVDGFPGGDGRLPLEADPVLSARLTPGWARVLRAQAQRWMPPGGLDGQAARANVAALHASGVRVLAGTDAPNPGLVIGLSLHRELGQLVRAGLSPTEAITAATSAPCEVFALTDRGRVAPGARADLLLLEGDPREDVSATGRVQRTWVGGQPVQAAPGDGEAEEAQIAWIRATSTKILAAVKDLWPDWVSDHQPEVITLTGSAEVDAVLPALTHPDKNTRQGAAVALGTLAEGVAAPAMVARLRDEPDFFVRETLTWAVTRLGEAARGLVEELVTAGDGDSGGDGVGVVQALHVLSKIASPASLPVLSRYTGATDPEIAVKARAAIARTGDPAGVPLLVRHLGQGEVSARGQLTTDLASYPPAVVQAVVDLVVVRLSEEDPLVRRHAAEVLVHLGMSSASAAPALERGLHDPDDVVRLTCAMGLFGIGVPGQRALSGYRGDDPRLQALVRRVTRR